MGMFDLQMGGGAGTDFVGNFSENPGGSSGSSGINWGDISLGPEGMAKILGLFSGNKANEIAMMNAMRPIMGSNAASPGHVTPSQVKVEDTPRVAPVAVVPGLAQLLRGGH